MQAHELAVLEADGRLQALRLEQLAAEKDREGLEAERARIAADLEVGALEASGLAGADGAGGWRARGAGCAPSRQRPGSWSAGAPPWRTARTR